MQLQTLLKPLRGKTDGPLDRDIAAICYDSRRVTPGALFVALPGENADGHEFVQAAIERGAAAVVVARNGIPHANATLIRVPDTRRALAMLAAEFYAHPADRLKMIGTTGTNGKTTVSFMVKHLLQAAGIHTGLIGTVRYEIGDRTIPATRTTPQAVELQEMLAQMLKAGCAACSMEVSSHALDQQRILGVEFDAAVFTNLTRDHLDYHKTMERYFATKRRLFETLGAQKKKTFAVVNTDDPRGEKILQTLSPVVRRISFGSARNSDIRARDIVITLSGSRFTAETPVGRTRVSLPLIGRHNVANALAALGVGIGFNLSLDAMALAFSQMRPVPGRLEGIGEGQPFRVFVDYAHTHDALRNVLLTLRELKPRRLIVVFGAGGSRDTRKRPLMGRVASELADFSILTSDNPRKEEPRVIIRQIEAGFSDRKKYDVAVDRREAIERALRVAEAGDIVLIAGKGHETLQEYADTIVPFDDREVAREILAAWKN